jgi:hypothetical protein
MLFAGSAAWFVSSRFFTGRWWPIRRIVPPCTWSAGSRAFSSCSSPSLLVFVSLAIFGGLARSGDGLVHGFVREFGVNELVDALHREADHGWVGRHIEGLSDEMC